MEQLLETTARPQRTLHFMTGFLLAIFFQAELHTIIRPTVGRYYGDFEFIGYLFTYSLPVWRECAFFSFVFLALAALVPRNRSALAWGIAACGLLDAALLTAAVGQIK